MEKNLGQDLMELRWVNHQHTVEILKIIMFVQCLHALKMILILAVHMHIIYIYCVSMILNAMLMAVFSAGESLYPPVPFILIIFISDYLFLSLFFFFTPSSWESKTLQNTPSKRKNVPTSIMQKELNTALWKSKCAMFGCIEMYYCPHSPFPILQYGT